MKRFIFVLSALICLQTFVYADEELDERLKAVMLLFDKKHQELTVQISELESENQKLSLELEKLQSHNQALIVENQLLKKKLEIFQLKQVETAASPKALEGFQGYSDSPTSTPTASSSAGMVLKTNVNTANQAELELLPGVGPVIAQRIVDNRPYATVDDLLKVNGIGKMSIEVLRPLIRVE